MADKPKQCKLSITYHSNESEIRYALAVCLLHPDAKYLFPVISPGDLASGMLEAARQHPCISIVLEVSALELLKFSEERDILGEF